MCRAVYDHVRAKSDALLKALSDKGGVTGIATLGYFVGRTADASLDDYLRHVDHAVKVAGTDHVGLASDYSIRGIAALHTRESWYEPRLRSFPPEYRVRWPPWIPEPSTATGLAGRFCHVQFSTRHMVAIEWAAWFAFMNSNPSTGSSPSPVRIRPRLFRISRSSRSEAFSRRTHQLRPFLGRQAIAALSRVAIRLPHQVRMHCAEGSNSRPSDSGLRPLGASR
jgi:hypothetical protein